ncbi:hypothetical protein LJC17_02875 [Acholeplasma sp. OttesenSCG-928-E16]|nr:hypothetical protein [Acholeplasma sp. OttesenSCG-928-E16]
MKDFKLKEQYSTRMEAEEALAQYNEGKSEEDKMYYWSYLSAIENRWMYCIVTKKQWYALKAMERDESDRIDEESRCVIPSERYGLKKCRENCDECPYGKTKREGNPLSYDKALEDGLIPDGRGGMKLFTEQVDPSSDFVDDQLKDELTEILNDLLDELDPKDRKIIELFSEDYSDSEIAKKTNSKKSTIQYRRKKIITELKIKIEEYL